jgi:hypothetical protein
MNKENKSWTKCQYECVQSFSEYTQGRILFLICLNLIDILSSSIE